MPTGGSLFGNALLFVSLLGTVGIGVLATLGLLVALARHRLRSPRKSSELPNGWRVIEGGRAHAPHPDSPAHRPRVSGRR